MGRVVNMTRPWYEIARAFYKSQERYISKAPTLKFTEFATGLKVPNKGRCKRKVFFRT